MTAHSVMTAQSAWANATPHISLTNLYPNLNLNSAVANISLQPSLFQNRSSLTINIDGRATTYSAGQKVTAAEFIALEQVAGGGSQTILLGRSGTANGGSFNLDLVSPLTSGLLVPKGVTALDTLSSSNNFSINGNLINFGSLYVVSTDSAFTGSLISSKNIINEPGAIISSSLPASIVSSITGAMSGADINLVTSGALTNAGTISSLNNVNLTASSLINSGLISSSQANINIHGLPGFSNNNIPAFSINNAGGTISATNGTISMDTTNPGKNSSGQGVDLYLAGGNYFSQQLNINTGSAAVYGTVGQITGTVNSIAGAEHLNAATQNLILGNNTVDGDPTFANTAGGITITGVNTFTENVAILASGDVTTAGGGQIVARNANVTIVAGAKVATTGATSSAIPGTQANQNVVVTLDPALSPGGNIKFDTNAAATVIDTSSTATGGSGGAVTLVAMASNGGAGGSVLFGNNGINTSALGSSALVRNGGNVTIIAGANPTAATPTVTVGSIVTGGGFSDKDGAVASNGGAVSIYTQQAKSSATDSTVTFDTKGTLVGKNTIQANGLTINTGAVTVNGDINTAGTGGNNNTLLAPSPGASAGAITITAGADISTKNLFAFGAGGGGGSHNLKDDKAGGGAGGAGAPVTLASERGNITVAGSVNTSGGGGGGGGGYLKTGGTGGGAGGNAANISIIAERGSVALTGTIYAMNGGAGGTGNLPTRHSDGFGTAGGGGGSYGGGGAGGNDSNGGGGGGGGIFGGGANGGGGGSATSGGTAGGAGGAGSANQGGNGGTAVGGALGKGGGKSVNPTGGSGGTGLDATASIASVLIESSTGVTTGGEIRANTLTVAASGAGAIALGGNAIAAKSVVLTSQSGAITEGAGVSVTTGALTLGTAAAIGSLATPFAITSNSLTVNRVPGKTAGLFISDTSDLTISDIATSGATVITARSIKSGADGITAAAVKLTATAGVISVNTTTQDLSTQSSGDTFVRNFGPVTINVSGTTAGGKYTLEDHADAKGPASVASVNIAGAITAGTSLSLIVFSADPIGSGLSGSGMLTAKNIFLNMIGGNVTDIGSAANPLITSTAQLQVATTGGAYFKNTGSISVDATTFGSAKFNGSPTFSLTTVADAGGNGAITVDKGGITGTTPAALGFSSSIILNSTETTGKGGIAIDAAGILKADSVTLTDGLAGAGTGTIGLVNAFVKVNTSNLTVNTTKDVFVQGLSTGNINVGNSSAGTISSQFDLIAAGTIDGAANSGTITASNIVLVGKDIGTATSPVNVNAAFLTLDSGKSVFANDASTGQVVLLQAVVFGKAYNNLGPADYSVLATGSSNLTNAQAIKSANITLIGGTVANANPLTATDTLTMGATAAGTLSVVTTISAPTITLSAGSGSIVQAKPTGTIKASKALNIVLTAGGTANLQAAPNAIGTLNDNVTGAGQVLFTETDSTKIGTIQGAGQNLTVAYTGSLATTTSFSVNNLTLTPSGLSKNDAIKTVGTITTAGPATYIVDGTGNLEVGSLAGSNTETLTASGKGNITLNGAINALHVFLNTNGGNIAQGANAPITTIAALDVNLKAGGTADLSKSISSVATFNDNVVGAGKVLLATQPTVTVNNIVGDAQNLTILSADSIMTPNPIAAAILVLKAAGAQGIGSITPVSTNATSLTVRDVAAGAKVVVVGTNTAGFTLLEGSADDTLNITSAGSITVSGPVVGTIINLASGGNGNVNINAPIGGAGSAVTITAAGSGNVATAAAKDVITGQTVIVSSGTGSIGAGAKIPLTVSTPSLTLNSGGSAAGAVQAANTFAGQSTLNPSTSGLSFSLTAAGPLNVDSITTKAGAAATTGSINITVSKGELTVLPNAVLKALGGNIFLQNNDIAGGSILIGSNSQIIASSTDTKTGNVTINLGVKVDVAAGTMPPNVIEDKQNGGLIFYGVNGITTVAPDNNLKALGRNITFDSDSKASGSIQLGGGVLIQADPPQGSAPVALQAMTMPAIAVPAVVAATSPVQLLMATPATAPIVAAPLTISASNALIASDLLAQSITAPNSLSYLNSLSPLTSQAMASSQILQGGVSQIASWNAATRQFVTRREIQADIASLDSDKDEESTLQYGNVVFAPRNHAKTVHTPMGDVKISAGAMALVIVQDQSVGIYAIDDKHAKSVTVAVAGQQIDLAPGRHLALTNHTHADFETINPSEIVLYRRVNKSVLNNGCAAFTAEFHLPSALGVIKPVREMLLSHGSADKRQVAHLIKTVAIMTQLDDRQTTFKLYSRPYMTAYGR